MNYFLLMRQSPFVRPISLVGISMSQRKLLLDGPYYKTCGREERGAYVAYILGMRKFQVGASAVNAINVPCLD